MTAPATIVISQKNLAKQEPSTHDNTVCRAKMPRQFSGYCRFTETSMRVVLPPPLRGVTVSMILEIRSLCK